MRLPHLSVTAVLVVCSCASSAAAQGFPSEVPQETAAPESPDLAPPLYAATVTGAATLTRDGATSPLDANAPVIDGDRIRTSAGRVELAGSPSANVFIDEHSVLDIVSSERLRAVGGRVRVVVKDVSQTPLSLDVPGGTVRSGDAGSYTVEIGQGARGDEVRLLVTEGTARFETDEGPLLVKTGESMTYRGGTTPELAATNTSPAADDLQRWADDQRSPGRRVRRRRQWSPCRKNSPAIRPRSNNSASGGRTRRTARSGIPQCRRTGSRTPKVGGIASAATAGSGSARPRGPGPRIITAGGGSTRAAGSGGPTDAGPPRGSTWAVAPGYVGWCPLGPDNRPARGVADAGNRVTYYRGGRAVGGEWHGWSMIPREAFDSRQAVTRARVDPRTIPREVASSFVTQRVPPPSWGRPPGSVPRVTVPLAAMRPPSSGAEHRRRT